MIEISSLKKQFRIYRGRKAMLKQILGLAKEGKDFEIVTPLKGISLTVPNASVHGIIGMNGAGKSTLLKILTGVIDPSSGSFKISGRVAALLELGTGFHSELSGRENVYLNASLAGLSKAETDERIQAIEQFAELGAFFDRPVRIYSSGMYVRLAFSFAVAIDPNVLIIDEALSVGDAYFQQKCLRKISEFKERGVTILFVSHDLAAVRKLCDQVTVLSQGEVIYSGHAQQALELYNALLAEHKSEELSAARISAAKHSDLSKAHEFGSRDIEIQEVSLQLKDGAKVEAIESGTACCFEVKAKVNRAISNPTCGILIRDRLGHEIFGINTYQLNLKSGDLVANRPVTFRFQTRLDLGAGEYTLTVALHSHETHTEENYHWIDRALVFKVLPQTDYKHIGVVRLEVKGECVR